MSAALTPVIPDPITNVALGLMAQLGALFPSGSFELRWVPAVLNVKTWSELFRRGPFVGLGWVGFEATNAASNGGVSGTARFSVFLAVKNSASVSGRYIGDTVGIGLFAMLSVALVGLNRWRMPGVGSVLVQKADHGALDGADESLAMAVLDVEVRGVVIDVSGAIGGFSVGEFQKLAASYVENGETLLADNYPVGTWP